MSTSAAHTYEQQNDAALDSLFNKAKALRGITIDIHGDSERQRGTLSSASDTFDQFGSRLSNTSSHFQRTITNAARGHRLTLYLVGAVVGVFLIWHFFF
ncbi:hypothetical protein CF327_g6747 [Tilletia walkeri]|uniref:t-SNARE coiled-coil homology domain-containing protein n=2 Tax=Tilletia TaxID=13289 RepID=A0A8X7T2R7_9BASI|nr:hypothetical protein CF327_g6747 [Tilletia walkeri]KAE8230212.1 hypothetical protein CF326_g4795 [Tilletia indica]KAE8246883.1 hypothetical protein A4X13_0g5589 [Tilletia indica]KAE8266008.1 hypothetical protein A4X09_0g6344 [Tilletia walkeri]